jgi:hypothetical protein
MPCQQCRGSDDCGDLIENRLAEAFGFSGKPMPLAIRKSKAPTSELLSENTILLDEILHDMLLPLVHLTGNGNDEKRKWIQSRLHRRSVSRPESHYAGAVCRAVADMNQVSGHYGSWKTRSSRSDVVFKAAAPRPIATHSRRLNFCIVSPVFVVVRNFSGAPEPQNDFV